jgi:hypothetical protein
MHSHQGQYILYYINHQSINPLTSINHLTSINQTIGINDNMIQQDLEGAGMAVVPVYLEALRERNAVLHTEGEEIELPKEEEYLPSVLEGVETKDESPPALEGAIIETLSIPYRAVAEEAIVEREWRSQFHIEQPQRR